MSVILFSHPRSGSSHYTLILHRHFQRKYKKLSIYLFEFFVIHCTDTFGSAGDVFWNTDLYSKPIQVRVLEDSAWNLGLIKKTMNLDELQLGLILKEKTVIFKDYQEVKQWYIEECLQRLRWLKFLTNNGIHYVVKHFFLSKDLNIDKELAEFAKSTQQAKLYYRQDFYQTLLSHLIKTYYFDLPAAQAQSSALRSTDAHNMGNTMPPLLPEAITLEKDRLLHFATPFVLFLKFAKDNQFDARDILLYEDFLAKKPVVIEGEEVSLEKPNRNSKFDEFPMNYAVSKDRYFTNSELIKSVMHEKLVDSFLLETAQMLDIQLS